MTSAEKHVLHSDPTCHIKGRLAKSTTNARRNSSTRRARRPTLPPSPAGVVQADEGVLAELEAHGYTRDSTLKHLANGEANYAVASYYLLAEAKAEAARKLMPRQQHTFSSPVAASGGGAARRPSGAGQAPEQQQHNQQQQAAASARPASAGVGWAGPAVAVAAT